MGVELDESLVLSTRLALKFLAQTTKIYLRVIRTDDSIKIKGRQTNKFGRKIMSSVLEIMSLKTRSNWWLSWPELRSQTCLFLGGGFNMLLMDCPERSNTLK
jgi:hypothetical protein